MVSLSPFSYALVRTDNRGLDVNWVIPHPPQLQSLIKRAHHIEGVMALWNTQTHSRRFVSLHLIKLKKSSFEPTLERKGGCRKYRERALVILTSTGISQLSAPQEAQVARPRPHSLGVAEAELGVEVVSMQRLLTIDCVVACGVVRTAHPDLLHTE